MASSKNISAIVSFKTQEDDKVITRVEGTQKELEALFGKKLDGMTRDEFHKLCATHQVLIQAYPQGTSYIVQKFYRSN